MDNQRFEKLLGRYLDEGLTADTKAEFERMLLASSEARERFWERARTNSMLRQWGQESWGSQFEAAGMADEQSVSSCEVTETGLVADCLVDPMEDTKLSQDRKVVRQPSASWMERSVSWMGWIVAACVLLVTGMWSLRQESLQRTGRGNMSQVVASQTRSAETQLIQQADWVALLRRSIGVQWSGLGKSPSIGEPLMPCKLEFDSGLVEIQTRRGALMVLEGPASLEIISDMEVRCTRGRLRVDVPPPAEGFMVQAPYVNLIDRGTVFAVEVSESQDTEIHVIDGMVELISPSGLEHQRKLLAGESVVVASVGSYQEIPSKAKAFLSESRVRSESRDINIERRKAWERRRDSLSKDENCLLYFDFNRTNRGDTILTNLASKTDRSTDGTIIGCDWTQGRWPGKGAVDLKNMSDRIRFSLSGEYSTLTCVASVRLDSMDGLVNTLLSSGVGSPGDIHWQIAPKGQGEGRLSLGRRVATIRDELDQYDSPPVFRNEQFGTWIQLAFVWDAAEGTVRQYVDGTLVSVDPIRAEELGQAGKLRLGQVEIGNGSQPVAALGNPVRNFNGRIDEFVVFDTALESEEILAFQELGSTFWSNGGRTSRWDDASNWSGGVVPSSHDVVRIDRSGNDKLKLADATTEGLNSIYVGSAASKVGVFDIDGGTLVADGHSDRHSRVGVAGGDGVINQSGGAVTVNSLQVGLDAESKGVYRISGGTLNVVRAVRQFSSIEVGSKGGLGVFEISGGRVLTRRGVTLGNAGGNGIFRVIGADAEAIGMGSLQSGDGFWIHNTGSTLHAVVGEQGLTTISIAEVGDNGGGDVVFADGALLRVGFEGVPRAGSWDVMKWQGKLLDHGLEFDREVDQNRWSFHFVDTDSSGEPDTLRVTASEFYASHVMRN
ncbi:LamG-like jellyroll fold domain-containing protein [Neorhodopirellula lusitana]|uniref:LamG-like jellyroll fold domain-containing protein n=1 Tax=Neorhodopirellula lusitana TaxID=445327 RepID=UPI0038504791